MPDRILSYQFVVDDESSGPLDLIESKATSLEMGFRRLTEVQNQLIQGQQAAAQLELAHAEALEELTEAGIQTTASIEQQIQKYDRLLDFVQGDIVATGQLTARKQALQNQLKATAGAQGQFNAASGQSSAFLNNLAFTLNDAQQAQFGFDQLIRATSNNIGVMIGQFQGVISEAGGLGAGLKTLRSQLIGGLGISVAFSAVSTAAVLLQNAFKDTSKEGKKTGDELQDAFSPLLRIVDAVEGSFEATFDDLEERQAEYNAQITATEEAIKALRLEAGRGRSAALSAQIAGEIEELNKQLKEQQDNLAIINSQLEDEQQKRELITQGEALGLKFNKEKTLEQKRQAKAVEDERKAKEAANKLDEENKTDLEELIEKRQELVRLLSSQNAGQFRQVVLVEREIEKLEELAEKRRQLILDQAVAAQFGEAALPVRIETRGLEDLRGQVLNEDNSSEIGRQINDLVNRDLEGLSDGAANVDALSAAMDDLVLKPRQLSDEVISSVQATSAELNDRLFADVQRFIDLNQALSDSIKTSLTEGVTGFGEALGDVITGAGTFRGLGQQVLLTLADLAGNIGKQLIGFGVAGLALRRLVTNPVAAIVAGTALVALSRVARNRIQSTINGATSGGSVSSFGGSVGASLGGPGGNSFANATPRNSQEEHLRREEQLEEERASRERQRRQSADARFAGLLEEQRRQREEMQALTGSQAPYLGRPDSLSSSPLPVTIAGGLGAPVLPAPPAQRLELGLVADEPIVLPGGTILLSIREALTEEVELGGSGVLEAS